MIIGRNALYYEDYVLAIQYFNQVILAKPHLAEPYFFRAIAKYYLEDFKGTEDDCTLALDRNPFMTRAYQLRADARQGQSKYKEALDDYHKALKANPHDKFSLINVGIVNMQLKEYKDAESALDNLTNLHPKYVQAYLVKGAMYTESGDTIKAFKNYDHAIELDKYEPQAYSMRGILYYHTQQYDSALVDINEAINLDPMYVGNYINRGLVRYSMNDLRGSMSDYDKVIEKEPNNIIARFNRGLLRAQVGDNNNAIEDFNTVLKFEPNNYMAIYNRALLKNAIADYNGAIEDMDLILEKYPEFYNGYYVRSQIKREKNDLKGSERDYNTARNLESLALKNSENKADDQSKTREQSDDDLDKFNLLVIADKDEQESSQYKSERRGRVQNRSVSTAIEPSFVLTYYEKADQPKTNIFYSRLIQELNDSGILPKVIRVTNEEVPLNTLQIDEHFNSINYISGYLENDSLNAKLYFARAIDFMLVQDFQNAILDLSKAISLDPEFTLAYFTQAVVYSKQLELSDYTVEYETGSNKSNTQMMSSTPTVSFGGSTNNITIDQSKINPANIVDNKRLEYEAILRNYNKVIELNPEFAYAYYNRANLKYNQGDYRGAILDYNEAIRRNPNFYEAFYNRGLSRFQIKDKDRALEDMRKAGEGGIISAYGIIKRMTE